MPALNEKLDIDLEAREYLKHEGVSSQHFESTLDMVKKMMTHECYGNPDYEWSLDDFELANRLGRGKFGRVYLAREKKTSYLVALKTMSKREITESNAERIVMREIEIQSHLKHKHILQLLCWFHDDHRIYLCLEYAGKGELFGQLQNTPNKRFEEPRAAKYIYQVASALQYCHENDVIHRDIKPENLLLTFMDDVKIADFGWSVHTPSHLRNTMCGTLDYLPPEMVTRQCHSIYVDHWCLGILCYEFLVGFPPFEAETTDNTYKKIRECNINFPNHVSVEAKDLIRKLVKPIAKERLPLLQVQTHPWIMRHVKVSQLKNI